MGAGGQVLRVHGKPLYYDVLTRLALRPADTQREGRRRSDERGAEDEERGGRGILALRPADAQTALSKTQ